MWEAVYHADFEKRLKKLFKRHGTEVTNALNNLNTYVEALQAGLTPQQIIRGWVHPEPNGIKAIDEAGPRNPRKAIRLYVYPEVNRERLHVMTIGDKNGQSEDIRQCQRFVAELLTKNQAEPVRDETQADEQTDS